MMKEEIRYTILDALHEKLIEYKGKLEYMPHKKDALSRWINDIEEAIEYLEEDSNK